MNKKEHGRAINAHAALDVENVKHTHPQTGRIHSQLPTQRPPEAVGSLTRNRESAGRQDKATRTNKSTGEQSTHKLH